ncbi:MAG: holo-ACP synthase [Bacteroidales bacterium]|nr:holo-ACP synthase [Bacteroidales bacterium]
MPSGFSGRLLITAVLIFGIGNDIVEVGRVQHAAERTSGFLKKLFTEKEQTYCENQKAGKYQSYAARYAAKEAFFKAMGTGYRYGFAFHEVEVLNDELGKPEVTVSGRVAEFLEEKKIQKIYLTLSHVKEMATAFVVLEY